MNKIIKYVSDDGIEFNSESKCRQYEFMVNEVNWIEGHLDDKPNTSDYGNGCGYIQHNKETVIETMKLLLLVIKRFIPDHKPVDEIITEVIIRGKFVNPRTTIVTRLIDEMCPKVIQNVWFRFYCMDDQFREWGQPYFAMNPDKGESIQLNGDIRNG